MNPKKHKLLIFTNVFPRPQEPNVGFYVFEQVTRLQETFDLKVIVATPKNIFNNKNGQEPMKTEFRGVEVYQPGYLTFPKMGVLASGYCYSKAVEDLVKEIHEEFPFELLIAYWTYPEGRAAVDLGKKYRVPVLLRPRGSDVNVFFENAMLRSLIRKTLIAADRVIPVTEALKNRIRDLGVPEKKLSHLHNGIKTSTFYPMDKSECRRELNIDLKEKMVLFIGNFVGIKGIDYLLEAIEILDQRSEDCSFYFLGKGPLKERIAFLSFRLKKVKVSLVGDVAHDKLAKWLNASDVLCLPSLNEGCPNVVMEALACGVPVVASRVGGVPELINDERLGILVPPKDSVKLGEAIVAAFDRTWDRKILLKRVEGESWEKVVETLKEECMRLIEGNKK